MPGQRFKITDHMGLVEVVCQQGKLGEPLFRRQQVMGIDCFTETNYFSEFRRRFAKVAFEMLVHRLTGYPVILAHGCNAAPRYFAVAHFIQYCR